VSDNLDTGVDRINLLLRRLGFRRTDAIDGMDYLPLQIGKIDNVEINQTDVTDTGSRDVELRLRAERPGTEDQHFGIEQLRLTFLAHLRNDEVA